MSESFEPPPDDRPDRPERPEVRPRTPGTRRVPAREAPPGWRTATIAVLVVTGATLGWVLGTRSFDEPEHSALPLSRPSIASTPVAAAAPGLEVTLPDATPAPGAPWNERLAAAATLPDPSTLESLLQQPQGPVDATDAMGRTALWQAAAADRPENARRLLAAGADPDRRDAQGVSAVALARRDRRADLARLLESDADRAR